jgi:hypothetical protein
MRLLNVRLTPDDARVVAALRRAGVPISRIVREAIRAEHGRQTAGPSSREKPSAVMARIYVEHPDPPGRKRRHIDLRDRRAVRRAVARGLRRRS